MRIPERRDVTAPDALGEQLVTVSDTTRSAAVVPTPTPAPRSTIRPEPRPGVSLPAPADNGGLPAYRRAMAAYETARAQFVAKTETYWDGIASRRSQRSGLTVDKLRDSNFVNDAPPVAPRRPNPTTYGLPEDFERPPQEPSTIKRVPDFLESARVQRYALDVSPRNGTDAERAAFETAFRERYVAAAREVGLTREQLLGVFTFETGGNGTHDLQSGLNAKGEGRPASTALGYAQLLAAKSIDVIATHGDVIADRLQAEGQTEKAALVRLMRRQVRAVHNGAPNWGQAQAMARTDLGRGVHAANLDLYIGPHLQVTKLEDTLAAYQRYASANGGMPSVPTPATLESMNLAGETNGFFMAHPKLADKITPNFFDGAGYVANPITRITENGVIVRPRTAGELQTRIGDIMVGTNSERDGTLELGRIWDRLQ